MSTTPTSIFENTDPDTTLWQSYDVEIAMLARLGGALPTEPASISEMVTRQMMRSLGAQRSEIDHQEWKRRVQLFMAETGTDPEEMTDEELEELANKKSVAGVNRFRRDEAGLYFPNHSLKAAIKEAISVLHPKDRMFGASGQKGGKNFIAEAVFVRPTHIPLMRGGEILQEADGVHTLHGTVWGPQGPRPIVTQHEYVEQARLAFRVDVLRNGKAADRIEPLWPELWKYMEENGIGAHRKMTDYGRFVVTKFVKL